MSHHTHRAFRETLNEKRFSNFFLQLFFLLKEEADLLNLICSICRNSEKVSQRLKVFPKYTSGFSTLIFYYKFTPLKFLSILCLLRPNAFMYGFILMILMSHVLCFDQNRRRFGFDGLFDRSRLGCRQIEQIKVCTFLSRKRKHET